MQIKTIFETILDVHEDGTCYVVDQHYSVVPLDPPKKKKLTLSHCITYSDCKYGILVLGRNSEIAKVLPPSMPITISCSGKTFQGHTHSKERGRIDGITGLTKCFYEGLNVNLEYDIEEKILYIL